MGIRTIDGSRSYVRWLNFVLCFKVDRQLLAQYDRSNKYNVTEPATYLAFFIRTEHLIIVNAEELLVTWACTLDPSGVFTL